MKVEGDFILPLSSLVEFYRSSDDLVLRRREGCGSASFVDVRFVPAVFLGCLKCLVDPAEQFLRGVGLRDLGNACKNRLL